jgi:magnesium-transporting ATPase (P-type)
MKVKGEERRVELLEVFPFNSDRKRMSVVVREDGVIKMYCKGV